MSAIPAELRGPDVREWNAQIAGALSNPALSFVQETAGPTVSSETPFGFAAVGPFFAEYIPLGTLIVPPPPAGGIGNPQCRIVSGVIDNDLRITVNGAVVYDRRFSDPFWGKHYYDIPFSAPVGATVKVDVFDGGAEYETSVCRFICTWPTAPIREAKQLVTIGISAPFTASIGAWTHSTGSGFAAVGFTRLRADGGRLYGRPVVGNGSTWQAAVASLRWRSSGLPWWGGAESMARAGTLVARDSWTDSTRAVRFVAGAGTTRAVAVGADGAVLTSSTFGASEYLADDWRVFGATVDEPPEVDITGLVLSGVSGATAFAVVRQSTATAPTDPTNPTDPGTGTGTSSPLPQTGSGFLYLRNGVATLVPARDYETEQLWTP